MKFFINTESKAYLRGLADELDESTNAIRVELNRLTKAGILEMKPNGRVKYYTASRRHPLFGDIQSIVKKIVGIDRLIDMVLAKLGSVELAFITGDYARGIDSGIIDLVIVGDIDRQYLQVLIERAEELISRKIRNIVLSRAEFERLRDTLQIDKAIIVWNNG